jgi:small GTP-binding protein
VHTLNLGILAHVDAGKTSLTERLLYAAGIVDEPGNVDDGNTQTDSLALERRRGITIRAAVVSFAIDDVTVNLIDTPGRRAAGRLRRRRGRRRLRGSAPRAREPDQAGAGPSDVLRLGHHRCRRR